MSANAGLRSVALLLAALLGLLALGGCASNRTGGNEPVRETRSNEAGDPQRRADLRLQLAGEYFARGQFDTALSEIRAALSARPDMPQAYSLRGLVQAAAGDLRGAEDSFQQALRLAPEDGDTLHNYGWFLCQQRRQDEADRQFARALANPQYRAASRTHLAQGVCLLRAGRMPEAERSLARAYELDPSNPVAAYNLSDVLLRRGELQRARFYVGRILAVPEQVNAATLFLAARIERRLGNVDAVQTLGRQLRDRFPQSPELQRLERGQFED